MALELKVQQLRKILQWLLLPVSGLYWIVLRMRHALFDLGIISSRQASAPTVVIGNLNLGGTGKTPTTQWLADHLSKDLKCAVLSRGYGRSSKGTFRIQASDPPEQTGDEPLLLAQAFAECENVQVWVGEDRLEAIETIRKEFNPDVVILDDAFQHRKLRGDFNILLTPWSKPWTEDFLLPAGGLRDISYARQRANWVIFTKAVRQATAEERARKMQDLNVDVPTSLSWIRYQKPQSFEKPGARPEDFSLHFTLTGIANPEPFEDHVESLGHVAHHFRYRDHHRYTPSDLENLCQKISTFEDRPAAVFTTMKDWMKIRQLQWSRGGRRIVIFVIDIMVDIESSEKLAQAIRNQIGNKAR